LAIVFVLVLAWRGEERGNRALSALAGALVAFVLPGLVMLVHPLAYLHGLGFLGSNAYLRTGSVPIGWIEIPLVIWPFGLGLGAFAAAVAGGVLAAVRREAVDVALMALLVAYFVVTGAGHEDFWRYQLPVLPVLSLLAGGLTRALPTGGTSLAAALAAALLLLLPSLYASVATDRLLGVTDTRRLAAQWLLANVPAGATLSTPYYGGPFYDQTTIARQRYYIDDALAAGYLQGRYTDRFRINAAPADVMLEASGPPYQYPLPKHGSGAAVVFAAYSGVPWDAVYDVQDSYYVPFWGFENIARPGPSIAIWTSSG
jgi:hypothetical protein